MKIRVGILLFTFFALLAWAYSASASNDLFKKAVGHYEGTLTSFERGEYTRLHVNTDLASAGLKNIVVKSEQGVDLLSFELSKIGNKDFILGGPNIGGQIKLKKDADSDCFSDPTTNADFCFYRDVITIEVTTKEAEYALYFNRLPQSKAPVLEAPKVYDLQTAIDHAWSFNFDNRIEFEHVIQAKFGAQQAKRSVMTPRISFTTIVSNIKPSVLSVIGAAGDLLPFLFPTRWLQAKHAAIMSQAEQDGMTLMRLDTATQIEAQFYALENYRQVLPHFYYAIEKGERLLKIVQLKVKIGAVQEVAEKEFFTKSGRMESDKKWLQSEFEAQKSAIAQVMGFYNMSAVQDAIIGTEFLPITKATPLVVADVLKTARLQSIELKQLQLLLDATKNNKKQVMWNWLDPQGDPSLGLGWALKSSVNVADSMLDEASLRKKKREDDLSAEVTAAVNTYNTALTNYPLNASLEEAQAFRLNHYEQELRVSGVENPDKAIEVLQSYIDNEIELQFDLQTFRTARAQIDRLLLQGFYEKATLPPKIDRKNKE